jgi:ADP-ribosylglycohydrolase
VTTLDRKLGLLLGTAIGDALGLPYEGLSRAAVRRQLTAERCRYRLLGKTGFVSDDTQLTVATAEAMLTGRGDVDQTVRAFRRRLLAWLATLPWGIGGATLRACVLVALGVRRSGRRSAGNGAAMRSAVVGAWSAGDGVARERLTRALAEVTHTDLRAVDGAAFVAEVAALAVAAPTDADREALVRRALEVVRDAELRKAIEAALAAGDDDVPSTGFVVHTLQAVVHVFVRAGADPLPSVVRCIRLGGDTDSTAAILGAWLGALHGAGAWPGELIARLQGGPNGREHLVRLAKALAEGGAPPRASIAVSLARNLAMFPVVLAHVFRRLAW